MKSYHFLHFIFLDRFFYQKTQNFEFKDSAVSEPAACRNPPVNQTIKQPKNQPVNQPLNLRIEVERFL
jgi:hypothetical protein